MNAGAGSAGYEAAPAVLPRQASMQQTIQALLRNAKGMMGRRMGGEWAGNAGRVSIVQTRCGVLPPTLRSCSGRPCLGYLQAGGRTKSACVAVQRQPGSLHG